MAPTNGTQKVLSPSKLAHIVLRTNKFEQMRNYYCNFLGGHVVHGNDYLAFITYDDEHHRIALLSNPQLQDNPGTTSGLEHIAFTFDNLQDLCTAYKQRKALGITPGWCVNHGPTTSMYYRDPDGNMIETQVDNYDTAEEATASMLTEAFAKNSLGMDYDPEELCRRVESGEDEASIKKQGDVVPRGAEDLPNIRAKMMSSQVGV
ncbi:hypothetical protein M409DRAFT_69186 [Zasmidium cellare ATCC 36951]|uniref:VOC domain-containing protein n=1 Tax=Zasmidium cellare ATCC 36951 TaxID=1080233 RepID=A0A6A6C562_ZASCE|nr:uncharacterized protein M409DRAFT_69186 [Zasmidium cellare ATCC 36951]KAF2162264.1 hypothetical protein M409DRAFT_69186 [Zasmidium cellare ATCC 36951]